MTRNGEVTGNVWPVVCSFIWVGIVKIDYHGKLFLGFNCKGVGRGCRSSCRADMRCGGSTCHLVL
jgi:hypothetical protein